VFTVFKKIPTNGITYIAPLDETLEWYWGTDYTSGDLYEAEDLFRDQQPIRSNRLVFVHYPDGRLLEPVKAQDGQYFGKPAFMDGKIHILYVDFPKGIIHIVRYDDPADQVETVVELPLSRVKDCYNLMLIHDPLTLVRQDSDAVQIIWPETGEYLVDREGLFARDGDKLYCARWYENENGEDYREELVVRHYPSGEVLKVIPGHCVQMPDGQNWILG
jgi:hypothetical protein